MPLSEAQQVVAIAFCSVLAGAGITGAGRKNVSLVAVFAALMCVLYRSSSSGDRGFNTSASNYAREFGANVNSTCQWARTISDLVKTNKAGTKAVDLDAFAARYPNVLRKNTLHSFINHGQPLACPIPTTTPAHTMHLVTDAVPLGSAPHPVAVDSTFEPFPIPNTDNTCSFASLLQFIIATPALYAALLSGTFERASFDSAEQSKEAAEWGERAFDELRHTIGQLQAARSITTADVHLLIEAHAKSMEAIMGYDTINNDDDSRYERDGVNYLCRILEHVFPCQSRFYQTEIQAQWICSECGTVGDPGRTTPTDGVSLTVYPLEGLAKAIASLNSSEEKTVRRTCTNADCRMHGHMLDIGIVHTTRITSMGNALYLLVNGHQLTETISFPIEPPPGDEADIVIADFKCHGVLVNKKFPSQHFYVGVKHGTQWWKCDDSQITPTDSFESFVEANKDTIVGAIYARTDANTSSAAGSSLAAQAAAGDMTTVDAHTDAHTPNAAGSALPPAQAAAADMATVGSGTGVDGPDSTQQNQRSKKEAYKTFQKEYRKQYRKQLPTPEKKSSLDARRQARAQLPTPEKKLSLEARRQARAQLPTPEKELARTQNASEMARSRAKRQLLGGASKSGTTKRPNTVRNSTSKGILRRIVERLPAGASAEQVLEHKLAQRAAMFTFLARTRERDMQWRRAQLEESERAEDHTGQAPADAQNVERLNTYNARLRRLLLEVGTCSMCKERKPDAAFARAYDADAAVGGCKSLRGELLALARVAEADPSLCTTCFNLGAEEESPFITGFDVDWAEEETDPARERERISALEEWGRLRRVYGKLSMLEEALIARVTSLTTVLALPAGGQLGYKGSCINFVADTYAVAKQLPRTPKESGLIFYRVEGKDNTSQLRHVRQAAVREWLRFLSKHHRMYKEGVFSDDGTIELIPPFVFETDFNEAAFAELPTDGPVPFDALETRSIEADPLDADEVPLPPKVDASEGEDDSDDDGIGGMDGDLDAVWQRRSALPSADKLAAYENQLVPNSVLLAWALSYSGNLAERVRAALSIPKQAMDDDAVLCRLYGLPRGGVRPATLTVRGLFTVVEQELKLTLDVKAQAALLTVLWDELLAAKELLPTEMRDQCAVDGQLHEDANAQYEDDVEVNRQILRDRLDGKSSDAADGTRAQPLGRPAHLSNQPISELSTHGYISLAFPTLFPFGRGDFTTEIGSRLTFAKWGQHLLKLECQRADSDNAIGQRFAEHPRFQFLVLNTGERQNAIKKAALFAKNGNTSWKNVQTVAQVRALTDGDRKHIANDLLKFGSTMRNSPGFYKERKVELDHMVEQLGSPHVFATHSHADTHCPVLHAYIVRMARLSDTEHDPFKPGLTKQQAYAVRAANLQAYPAMAAGFFARKFELFLEHIGQGIYGVDAYWGRYEWQLRGSSHIHFFLWLKDAPDLSYLDMWADDEIKREADGADYITEEQMDAIALRLTAQAAAAAVARSAQRPPRDDAGQHTTFAQRAAIKAADDAAWWAQRCTRLNAAWDTHADGIGGESVGRSNTRPHPAADLFGEQSVDEHGASMIHTVEDVRMANADLVHAVQRHSSHSTSYCLVRNSKTNAVRCRFGFPQEARMPNTPHLYCERVKRGLRWRLYLEMNDPTTNSFNIFQSASQMANVDFKPVIDHLTYVEYCTKYATKQESSSQSFQKVFKDCVERAVAANTAALAEGKPELKAHRVFSGFLIAQTTRNWSGQEVAHVNNGLPSVVASHTFMKIILTDVRKIKANLAELEPNAKATYDNKWDLYLNRLDFLKKQPDSQGRTQTTLAEHWGSDAQRADLGSSHISLYDDVKARSFCDFYKTYQWVSNGPRGGRQLKEQDPSTIVVVKPNLPKRLFDKKSSTEKQRAEYAHTMLRKHAIFESAADYRLHELSDEQLISTYLEFCVSGLAPARCQEDARAEEEGALPLDVGSDDELIDQPAQGVLHEEAAIFSVEAAYADISQAISRDAFDWGQHSASKYDAQLIAGSGRWLGTVAGAAPVTSTEQQHVDIDTLNPMQRQVYDVVLRHKENCHALQQQRPRLTLFGPAAAEVEHVENCLLSHEQQPAAPLRMLVMGTAGAGKSYLIAALKQLLGDECVLLAPTGVAADNIGAKTYHSALGLSVKRTGTEITVSDISPGKKKLMQLRETFLKVRYVLIDEVSMVGACALGFIDELLRQIMTNNTSPFGGLSVLKIGDFGQLPPVKDIPVWASNLDKAMNDWQKRGTKLFALFDQVFFLDQVMRAAGTSSDAVAFRELLLRSRDGTLTENDHQWMCSRLLSDIRKANPALADEFAGAGAYNLVATKEQRNTINAQRLQLECSKGAHAITLLAINTPVSTAALDAEDAGGLENEVHICVGARVMIIKNVCQQFGLVNGAMGTVHDILCDRNGVPISVLVRVRRQHHGSLSGYKGPSFLSDSTLREHGMNPAYEAVVALPQATYELHGVSRVQFPIALAWAVTIHKSQGLTLDRVVIDLGEANATAQAKDGSSRRKAVKFLTADLLFVAMSRVKHPSHVAFLHVPSKELTTSWMGQRALLRQRKLHEQKLRKTAQGCASTHALPAGQQLQPAVLHAAPPAPPADNVTMPQSLVHDTCTAAAAPTAKRQRKASGAASSSAPRAVEPIVLASDVQEVVNRAARIRNRQLGEPPRAADARVGPQTGNLPLPVAPGSVPVAVGDIAELLDATSLLTSSDDSSEVVCVRSPRTLRNGSQIILRHPLTPYELVRLLNTHGGNGWLTTTCIDAAMVVAVRRIRAVSGRVHAFTANFMPKLSGMLRGQGGGLSEANLIQLGRMTLTAGMNDLLDVDYLLFPLNVCSTHWVLGVVALAEHRFEVFDSLAYGNMNNEFFDPICIYLAAEVKRRLPTAVQDEHVLATVASWPRVVWRDPSCTLGRPDNYTLPLQPNGSDCGVWVVINAWTRARGFLPGYDPRQGPALRRMLAEWLLLDDGGSV